MLILLGNRKTGFEAHNIPNVKNSYGRQLRHLGCKLAKFGKYIHPYTGFVTCNVHVNTHISDNALVDFH